MSLNTDVKILYVGRLLSILSVLSDIGLSLKFHNILSA
jgi:hypothetical protein